MGMDVGNALHQALVTTHKLWKKITVNIAIIRGYVLSSQQTEGKIKKEGCGANWMLNHLTPNRAYGRVLMYAIWVHEQISIDLRENFEGIEKFLLKNSWANGLNDVSKA